MPILSKLRAPHASALVGIALAIAGVSAAPRDAAAEPASCLSPDPAQWPAPSKPYFMVIVDTSGSMGTAVGTNNSCGYPNDCMGHARCAMRNTVQAFSGQVNFGLASYTWKLSGCAGACYANCGATYAPGNNNFCGPFILEPTLGANVHSGGIVVVPMLQDHFWANPPDPTNVPALLSYVDNNCTNSVELGADSNTPLGGALFNMNRYFSGTFIDQFTNAAVPTPIGTLAQGERGCRSINVILITDGDETCDGFNLATYPNGEGLAVYEANRLFATGVTVGGQNFKVKTHVIGFAGATIIALNNIAAAGGTGASYSTANEAQLSQALANIVGGSVKPEACDNTDNNCNGCTDEGSTHYCDVQPVPANCCAWATDPQRTTCLTNYKASITPANPQGNLNLLPCTTAAQQTDPLHWLCFDPKEKCDNVDNNCQNGVDENIVKCGSPLACPVPEVCFDGKDNNCDGVIDEGCVGCSPSAEICDGCDNDCNGFTDNGIAPIPCGPVGPFEPPNCSGQITCKPPQAVPIGQCAPGGGFNSCNNNPQPETCDGLDNDCNSIPDDNVPSVPCNNGQPGLNYGPNSHCKLGMTVCQNGVTTCQGWVGPDTEICDGIDNDCDFQVDELPLPSVGQPCGTNSPPCQPGITACVNGSIVCTGGVGPKAEVCNGVDDDCNGKIDDGVLADAPQPGQNGCWDLPGNCCTFNNVTWCPPPGGTCNDVGSLTPPCNKGSLVCKGAQLWACVGPKDPSPDICDGVDNDCNGTVDDGFDPSVGNACLGPNVGECKTGLTQCQGGVVTCVGGVGPTPEICDNLDNDCNGVIDNGVNLNTPCDPVYDTQAYPGDRSHPPCTKGLLQCDGMGGTICVGGIGPSPEVCDGIDNDCDGNVDEPGLAPDGINGSANPNPPPAANVGDVCGLNQGECKEGAYACVNGQFQCLGGQGATPEQCDCKDNDCDGQPDNNPPNGTICGMGKTCVKSGAGCTCADKCMGEFGCNGGEVCEMATDQQTGMSGNYCILDNCGDCTTKTIKDANQKVVCAPAGTKLPNCAIAPVCVCINATQGCGDPCSGVTCMNGTVCIENGPKAGTCGIDNCFNSPCQGCDKVCNYPGTCIDDPCEPNPCAPTEECKPTADLADHTCVKSCGPVTCAMGEVCKDGLCIADCSPACAADETCDLSKMPAVCVKNLCTPASCNDGSCCNPLDGSCGNCPCEGVVCPGSEVCKDGQCQGGAGGSGGGTSTGTSTGAGAGASGTSTGAGANGATSGSSTGGAPGVWGLATGGGGCSCDVAGGESSRWGLAALAMAIGAALSRRRRAGRGEKEAA